MFWLGATVALCYVPGVTGMHIATQWPLLGWVLFFCLYVSVAEKISSGFAEVLPAGWVRSGPFTVFHAIGLAFVAYAFVRWPYSPVPYASVFGLWQLIIMALCVWFGSTMDDMRGLYAGLAAGAAVSSAVAIFQHFGFHPVETASPMPPGLYVNAVQQSTVLALIAVALASERMWLWLLPLAPGLYLAQSRGGWLVLVIGLLGCYVRRLWLFGVLGAAGAMAYMTLFSATDVERMFIWRSTWANLVWFGWGPGVFYSILLPVDNVQSFFPEYAHNDALQLIFEYGAGAVMPFAVFGYALWRTDAAEWPVVLAFVVAGLFSMPLFMPVASFLALVAVGRIVRDHGLAIRDRNHRGSYSVQRGRSDSMATGVQTVPVAPHPATEG